MVTIKKKVFYFGGSYGIIINKIILQQLDAVEGDLLEIKLRKIENVEMIEKIENKGEVTI